MNENLNLCEILKGHEGEIFYSPCFGESKFNSAYPVPYFESIDGGVSFDIRSNGTYCESGEICIFPSKEQRDWNKWIKEQNTKVPKTWSELVKYNKLKPYAALINIDGYSIADVPIEKSALALLKIYQLIEVGYGGNVTNEEWNLNDFKYTIYYYYRYKNSFSISNSIHIKYNIAFHTKEQAEEFLKYLENIQLLKDYFMID